jgi:hypothetical protein
MDVYRLFREYPTGYHREKYTLGYMFAECAQNYVR